MELNKTIIAVVSVAVAVLLVSGIVVPIIADATKPTEKTEWVTETGLIPGHMSLGYRYLDFSDGDYLSVTFDGHTDRFDWSYNSDNEEGPLYYRHSWIMYADNNIILYNNGYENTTDVYLIDRTGHFADQLIAEQDYHMTVIGNNGNIMIYLNYDGTVNYVGFDSNGDTSFDVSIDSIEYAYLPGPDAPDYSLFKTNPDIIPPTNPHPSISVTLQDPDTSTMYIGLAYGTYQIKSTVTEDPFTGSEMLTLIPLLMLVGIIVAVAGMFLKNRQ